LLGGFGQSRPTGAKTLSNKSKDPQRRAETAFKKVRNAKEGAKALSEYEATAQAVRERTFRLRALRLAKEAVEMGGKKKPITKSKKASV
jgi:hypothetical protein